MYTSITNLSGFRYCCHSILLLFYIVLAGCSSTGPRYKGLPTTQAGESMLVIYRGDSHAAKWRHIEFKVEDKVVAVLPNNAYTHITVAPKKYLIKGDQVEWVFFDIERPVSTVVDCKEALPCFVNYSISQINGDEILHRISTVPFPVAEREMQGTGYEAPKINSLQ